jgi:hypothetical protein
MDLKITHRNGEPLTAAAKVRWNPTTRLWDIYRGTQIIDSVDDENDARSLAEHV